LHQLRPKTHQPRLFCFGHEVSTLRKERGFVTSDLRLHNRLVLAGHTHGKQIRGPGCTPWVPRALGRFRQGFYDAPLGRVYVSRGIGTSVVPLRFLYPPEPPIFTLRRRG
jgi:predicted MPP superfamily phosphohydrolase